MVSVSDAAVRCKDGFVFRQDNPAAVGPRAAFNVDERLAHLQSFGSNSLSFSVFQKGMQFFDVPGKGFIAYKNQWGTSFVLSEPVCSEADKPDMIDRFLAFKSNTVFVQISEKTTRILHENHGFYGAQLGIESDIDLSNWTISGKKKQVLRTAINHARKKDIIINEGKGDPQEDELNRHWLRSRKASRAEIGFLIRPKELEYKEGLRKLYAYQGDRLIGFIFFDPVFDNNQIVGYVPNISRFCRDFKQGIFYCLMSHAIHVFRAEGVPTIHLGLSPAVVDDVPKNFESPLLKKLIRLTYAHGNSLYNFKGLYFAKSRFRGTERNVYCAHRHILPLKNFVCMFKICNVI
jgi:lysylphosphatidylglycerol synthetase-like protein (DUF2156 family)